MRFQKQEDGHYLDKKTGLIWAQLPKPGYYIWREAKDLEHDGWRLPTREELVGIVSKKPSKSIWCRLPHMLARPYWSSSITNSNPDYVWYVSFQHGGVGNWHRLCAGGSVRLVREAK